MSKEVYPSESVHFSGIDIICIVRPDSSYIAIKPLCAALEVDYVRQFKNIQKDPILGPALSKQTTQVGDDQPREYACLPERYIYGYIFQINSNSPKLLEYRQQVYDVLFNYFHGALASRKRLLGKMKIYENEIERYTQELEENPAYQKMEHYRKVISTIKRELSKQDRSIKQNQFSLFQEKPN